MLIPTLSCAGAGWPEKTRMAITQEPFARIMSQNLAKHHGRQELLESWGQ